ncbi:MAG: hypothetical protein BZ135_07345 [Methanosphaera sp. rholeuAM6]|nr:MAG: hypothetical protein BZ135_07345 [Methanosphaera sp. rholeuAM6]
MNGNKILGIIIIIALILSVALVGYGAVNKVVDNDEDNLIETQHVMDESELNKSEVEDTVNGTISTVNLNINQKTGGANIQFSDNTTTVYSITSTEEEASTNISTHQNGSNLEINIESNSSENTIVLSNKYKYNITGNFVAGGFAADLNNNSQVDNINVNTTLGGVTIELNGGSLNTLNVRITTGGLNIIGEPNGLTTVNSEIEIGGVNLQLSKPVADIFSNIELGGINPGDYQQISEDEYKGNDFDSSENKLIINNYIRVGGVNTQSFSY